MEQDYQEQGTYNPSDTIVQDTVKFPLIAEDSANVVKLQIDNREALTEFEMKLRGKVRDQEGNWIGPVITETIEYLDKEGNVIETKIEERAVGSTLLLDFGVTRVMAVLDILGNKGSFMGPTDAEGVEMKSMHFNMMKSIIHLFMTYPEECGFKSPADATLVKEIISSFAWSCMTRTRNGGERDTFRETTRVNQSVSNMSQKTGLFERFRMRKF